MILVTGATGTVGREVIKQLIEKKFAVRAMTRDPAKAKFPAGVEIVAGDFDEPESLVQAVKGAVAVFSLSAGPNLPIHDGNLAKAAKAEGVRRFVKLSAITAGTHPHQLIGKWHIEGERAIEATGLAWTHLRPCGFMSNALNWAASIKSQGKIFAPVSDASAPPVDPRDIAAVAVCALTQDGHAGKVYLLTGPESLSMQEQAAQLSEALGKQITYVAISDAAFREGMAKHGMPTIVIDAVIELAANTRSGDGAKTLDTVTQVTGQKGRRFEDWARDHRQAFL